MTQETIPATGGNASGISGSSNYSVGQVVYQTFKDFTGSVAEGVQQAYEIWVYTSAEEATGITLTVFPNPTKHFLTLRVKDFDLTGLVYQLFDFNGKLIHYSKITNDNTSIDMGSLVPAIYFVRVIFNRKEIKTFKIVKN